MIDELKIHNGGRLDWLSGWLWSGGCYVILRCIKRHYMIITLYYYLSIYTYIYTYIHTSITTYIHTVTDSIHPSIYPSIHPLIRITYIDANRALSHHYIPPKRVPSFESNRIERQAGPWYNISIHPFIHSSIHPFIHLSIYLFSFPFSDTGGFR